MADETLNEAPGGKRKTSLLFRAVTWLLALGCFYLVYTRMEAAAARETMTVLEYLTRFFGEANWLAWLALVIPYSLLLIVVYTKINCICIMCLK